jgi:O-antigen ligase
MLTLLLTFFGDILQDQIASRYYIFEASHYTTGESRLKEFDVVLLTFKDRPTVKVLFGENLFDTGDIWLNIFGYRRILHNDWTSLLASTGVVGLGIFTYLYFSILLRVFRSRPPNHDLMLHRSISLGLMISSIIWILFGGFYLFVASSTLIMFVVGSYLGQINAHKKRKISSA